MRIFLWCLMLCFAYPGWADESTPLLYSRSAITILTASANTPPPLPWQAKTADAGIRFDVHVRDGTTLYNQTGWYNLSSPEEKTGDLFVFAALTMAPIIPNANYTPLDILFVNQEGTVEQIAPSLVLAELQDEIYPKNPVLALLFLKGGTCETLGIKPGDEIRYPIFKKPPVLLTAPN